MLNAADQLLRQIHRRPQRSALPCMFCDSHTLWRGEPPAAVIMLMPFGGEVPFALRSVPASVRHCVDEPSQVGVVACRDVAIPRRLAAGPSCAAADGWSGGTCITIRRRCSPR